MCPYCCVLRALLVSLRSCRQGVAFVRLPLRRWRKRTNFLLGERAKEQCLCVWPEPLPGAPGAVPAEPGMDSEGWFAVNGWKYLVKWHHSGSYQLYPGKVLAVCAPCGWRGQAGLFGLQVCVGRSRWAQAADSPEVPGGREVNIGCA